MKAIIIGLGVGVVVGSAIMGQQPTQLAPKVEPVEVQPLAPIEVAPLLPPEAVPLPKAKPKSVEQQPKPKPKPKAAGVSPEVCDKIRLGISWLGKEGMRQKARDRGHSDARIAATEKQCGIT